MKYLEKKAITAAIVCSLLIGVLSISVCSDAKSTYWLSGVSELADGHMKMYYKGSTITLKGKIKKSASRKNVYDATEKKYSCSLKVANNCKVTLVEADNNQTMTYKKWAKGNNYKKGAKVSFIEATFKIDGGKITRIYFSA